MLNQFAVYIYLHALKIIIGDGILEHVALNHVDDMPKQKGHARFCMAHSFFKLFEDLAQMDRRSLAISILFLQFHELAFM